jgi:hypothetical protein
MVETESPEKNIEVSAPQDFILHSTSQYNLFMAGSGSGKTHGMGLLSAEYITGFPDVIGIIAANTYDQLNKSTLKRIFEVWFKEFGWINGIHFVTDRQPLAGWPTIHAKMKGYNNTISFDNGALIFVNSLDNYEAIDGQEVGWALLDETKDTEPDAVDKVIVWRLRQPGMWVDDAGCIYGKRIEGKKLTGFNPLYIFTSPAKEQWINEMFGIDNHYEAISRRLYDKNDFYHHSDSQSSFCISSTYHNSANLPDGFIERLEKKYRANKNLLDTFIYGSPISKVGQEFYHQFDRLKHVRTCEPEVNIAFHNSYDQNLVPYYTTLITQIVEVDDVWELRFLNEFCLENPENSMESSCDKFIREYDHICEELYYYGDVSGLRKENARKGGEHHYDVLEAELRPYLHNTSRRLLKSNPPVGKRREFINKIFHGDYNIRIIIDPKCVNLIIDLEFVKENADGTKVKKKVTDPDTKSSYEKYGHTSDAMDYLICAAFYSEFMAYRDGRF